MKKILFLGGTHTQVHAIKKSNDLGYYTIVTDYKKNAYGKQYARESYDISTIDKEAVLDLSIKLKIDGIISYSVDTPAITAAYVAEKMGLPGHHLKSVEILTNKDLFRKFLQDNDFNCPKAKGYSSYNIDEIIEDCKIFKKPIMVKPADSTGSRGISIINDINEIDNKIRYAQKYSRSGNFVLEEYIDGIQISGDLFVVNGNIEFFSYGKEYFYNLSIKAHSFSESFKDSNIENKMYNIAKLIISKLDIVTGVCNYEARINENNDIVLIEFTPRNAGNLTPILIKYATGLDITELLLKSALGIKFDVDIFNDKSVQGHWAYYVIRPDKAGKFKKLEIDDYLEKNIVELNMFSKLDDIYDENDIEYGTIAIMIMKFKSIDELEDKINNMNKYIKVIIE